MYNFKPDTNTNHKKTRKFNLIWLALIFVILKLTGIINWGWVWVFIPIWLPFLFIILMIFIPFFIYFLVVIYEFIMKKF